VEMSELHAEGWVMLFAKEVISFEQVVTLAAHVASRVWVIWTRDFSAWKKEREFY
jgi:hypothetical protein